jgi:hypothetical protein
MLTNNLLSRPFLKVIWACLKMISVPVWCTHWSRHCCLLVLALSFHGFSCNGMVDTVVLVAGRLDGCPCLDAPVYTSSLARVCTPCPRQHSLARACVSHAAHAARPLASPPLFTRIAICATPNLLLQYPDETLVTYVWNSWNTCSIHLKHLQKHLCGRTA